MKTLDTHFQTEALLYATSPAFQLFASDRKSVREQTLLGALDQGWVRDVNERAPAALHRRSLLLTFLGTLQSHLSPSPVMSGALTHEKFDQETQSTAERWTQYPTDFNNWRQNQIAQQVVERLLDAQANPYLQDRQGRDALDQIVGLGWLPLIDRMFKRRDLPAVDALMQRRLNVEHLSDPRLKASPSNSEHGLELPWLHAAVAHGHHPLIERLLNLGWNIDQPDDLGRTPLFYVQHDVTVRYLLDQGANPLAQDLTGKTPGQAWASMVQSTTEQKAMNTTMQSVLQERLNNDPQAIRAQQVPTLFQLAVTDAKATVLKFMKDNRLSVDERWVDPVSGRTMSLLGHVALHAIGHPQRSRTLTQYLFERASDVAFESLDGVPDVWLVQLASLNYTAVGGADLPQAVAQAMAQRYGMVPLDPTDPAAREQAVAGIQQFLDDGRALFDRMESLASPAMQALRLSRENPDAHAAMWAGFLRQTVERLVQLNQQVTNTEEQDPTLVASRDVLLTALTSPAADGASRAWSWTDRLCNAQANSNLPIFEMESLLGSLCGGKNGTPPIPLESSTFNVLLAIMGLPRPTRWDLTTGNVTTPPFENWTGLDQRKTAGLPGAVMARAIQAGLEADTARAGFSQRLHRFQQNQPILAQLFEQYVLNQTARAQPDAPLTPQRARTRL